MTGWRDGVASEAQADSDGLFNACLRFAMQCLRESGEFYPFGFAVTSSGEVQAVAADAGEDNHRAAGLMDLLVAGLVEERDRYRAAAVAAAVGLTLDGGQVSAVQVRIDLRDGTALEIYAPFELRGRRRKVVFGEFKAVSGKHFVWTGEG
jgi:hypothetical protein